MDAATQSLTTALLTGDVLVDVLTKAAAQVRAKYPAATPLTDAQAAEVASGLRTLAEAIEKRAAAGLPTNLPLWAGTGSQSETPAP